MLDYGVYLQDSWRAAPGLTVNVGLRWDGEQTRDYLGQTVLKFNNEWQPRVGVVWDPMARRRDKSLRVRRAILLCLAHSRRGLSFSAVTNIVTYNFDPVSVAPDPNVIGHERAGRRALDVQ